MLPLIRDLTQGLSVVAACSAFLLQGCGLRDNGRDTVQHPIQGTPVDYRLDDPDCQAATGADAIGPQSIFVWSGERAVQETYPFSVVGKESASSGLIDSTYYGYHQRRTVTCTASDSGASTCDEGDTEIIQKEQPLKLCRPSGPYARDSIENVTLTSMANLERAKSAYAALPSASHLTTASLLVLPNYEELKRTTDTDGTSRTQLKSDTDNAAFAPLSDRGRDVFYYVVYPRSREATESSAHADLRLWEVPWVMAHEFSHQVFYTHYQSYRTDSKLADLSLNPRAPFLNADHVADNGSALTAINEGFADVFAQALLGGDKSHARGIPCFENTRNVDSSTFDDGTPKALTAAARDEFFAPDATVPSTFCGTSFQDPHHIGAIFAHGFKRLFDTPGAILQWLIAFDAERQRAAPASPEDLWRLATRAAVIVARGNAQNLTAPQCEAVRSSFPLYAADYCP